jgi:DNA-directed RNA polymerase specialized sigma24 family protein
LGGKRTEFELCRFYDQWAPAVNTFCQLYLGNAQQAESVLAESFLQYFRGKRPLRLDHLPAALMSLTLEGCGQSGGGTVEIESALESAVLGLLPGERAVFVLHGVLDLQLPWVAAVTGTAYLSVCQLWVSALVQLRMAIVRDQCSQAFADHRLGAESSNGACA